MRLIGIQVNVLQSSRNTDITYSRKMALKCAVISEN